MPATPGRAARQRSTTPRSTPKPTRTTPTTTPSTEGLAITTPTAPPRPRRRPGLRRAAAVAAGSILLTAAHPLAAQQNTTDTRRSRTAEADPQLRTRAADLAPAQLADLWTADALTRALLERLRQFPDPTEVDYAVSALGLRIAQSLRPNDPALIRHEIDAWNAAGDRQRANDATRRLLRIEPEDAAARLRLLNHAADQYQTVSDRLAFYERALERSSLSQPVRSRLALDAALLARETGDDDRFINLLTTAATLDVTNKPAASLFATVFLDRAETPLERVEILANVVLADPLDPAALTNLASEFLRHAAYDQALRFLRHTRAARGRDTVTNITDRVLARWQAESPQSALELVAEIQQQGDILYENDRAQLIANDIDPGPRVAQLIQPEIELARLIILVSLGPDAEGLAFQTAADETETPPNLRIPTPTPASPASPDAEADTAALPPFATRRAYARTLGSFRQALDELQNPDRRPEDFSEQDLDNARRALRLNRVWMRLFAELDTDQARAELEQIAARTDSNADTVNPQAIERFNAWILALTGSPEEAAKRLEPLARDDPSAAWALAAAQQRLGRTRDAVRTLLLLARDHADTLLAGAARSRAERILNTKIGPSATATELNRYGKRFAPWLDEFVENPRATVSLTAELNTDRTIEPLDRPRIAITLSNLGSAPLAIGRRQSIPADLLITPQLTIAGDRIPQGLAEAITRDIAASVDAPPARIRQLAAQQLNTISQRLLEVVDTKRRIRIEPRSSFTFVINPNRGFAGAWLDQDLTARADIAHRLTLGFNNAGSGQSAGIVPARNALTTQTGVRTRSSLTPLAADNPLQLDDANGKELLRQILRASSALTQLRQAPDANNNAPTDDDIHAALADRIPSMTPRELAFTANRLAPLDQLPEDQPTRAALATALTADDDPPPAAVAALLIMVPRGSDDPLFDTALNHPDENLRLLAGIIRSVIERNERRADDAQQNRSDQTQNAPPPPPTNSK